MTNRLTGILFLISVSNLTFGQDKSDWPSSEYEYISEDPDEKEGFEYYKSGHLYARGPLTISGSRDVVKVSESRRQVKEMVYHRSGLWTIYYDSIASIVLCIGEYTDNKKNGLWKVFDKRGGLLSEYTFYKDIIQSQIEFDEFGKRNVIVSRSNRTVFLLRNEILLFFLGLLPIVGVRSFWNIVVWNSIYKTNYIPGFGKFIVGELNANVYCMLIFWWLYRDTDSNKVRTFKKIGNWISGLSLLIFGLFITFLTMYGE